MSLQANRYEDFKSAHAGFLLKPLSQLAEYQNGRANATGLSIVESFSDRRDRFISLNRGTPQTDVVLQRQVVSGIGICLDELVELVEVLFDQCGYFQLPICRSCRWIDKRG